MINPMTGMDEDQGMPGLPPTFAGAQGGGAPPELQQALQTLQAAEQVLGPTQQPPAAPAAPMTPAPTPAGQLGQIRQQQFGGLAQGQQLEQQQGQLDQQMGQVRQGVAADQAAFDAERVAQEQAKQDEQRQLAAAYERRQLEAKAASDQAAEQWANARPEQWLESKDAGGQAVTLLSMALAHVVDHLNANQGVRSNLGQQATAAVNSLIDRHRAQEIERIGGLKTKAQMAAGKVEQLTTAKAAAIAEIEAKYHGIEKALELQARAQRSAQGMDEARINSDQVVVDRTRRALEAEQRRLDALNQAVDRQMQMEISARRKAGGKGKGPLDPDDPYAGMTPNAAYKARMDDEAKELLNLDGTPAGKAKTVQEAVKLRKGQEATAAFIDNLNRMKAFIEREGTIAVPMFEAGARKERTALTTALAGNLTIMNETGVLNQGEYDRYAAVIEPSAWEKNARASELMSKLAVKAEQDYTRKIRSQGTAASVPGQQPPTTPSQLPPTRQAGQGPPAGIPAGAVRGSYQGRTGWRAGNRFYPD